MSVDFIPKYVYPVSDWVETIEEALGRTIGDKELAGVVEALRAAYDQGRNDVRNGR